MGKEQSIKQRGNLWQSTIISGLNPLEKATSKGESAKEQLIDKLQKSKA